MSRCQRNFRSGHTHTQREHGRVHTQILETENPVHFPRSHVFLARHRGQVESGKSQTQPISFSTYSQTIHVDPCRHKGQFLVPRRGCQSSTHFTISHSESHGISHGKVYPPDLDIGGHGCHGSSIPQRRGLQLHVRSIHMKHQRLFPFNIHAVKTEYPVQQILSLHDRRILHVRPETQSHRFRA